MLSTFLGKKDPIPNTPVLKKKNAKAIKMSTVAIKMHDIIDVTFSHSSRYFL